MDSRIVHFHHLVVVDADPLTPQVRKSSPPTPIIPSAPFKGTIVEHSPDKGVPVVDTDPSFLVAGLNSFFGEMGNSDKGTPQQIVVGTHILSEFVDVWK